MSIVQDCTGSINFDPVSLSLSDGVRTSRFQAHLKSSEGKLYLIFSKACNLRCPYCFQRKDEKSCKVISFHEVATTIRFFQSSIKEIVLFGGEPLLESNFNLISEILSRFDYLHFIIFTNGNFSSQFVRLLSDYCYCVNSVIITLDGSREIHNKRRFNPTSDSFYNVINNIKLLTRENITLDVQVNVDNENISDIPNLLEFIVHDPIMCSLDFTLNPVKYINNSSDIYDLVSIYFKLRKTFPSLRLFLNNRLIINLRHLLQNQAVYIDRCGFAKTFVCDFSAGSVYKCPQNVNPSVGKIKEGNVLFDAGKLHQADLRFTKTTTYENKCKYCEFNLFCFYGCPYMCKDDDCRETVLRVMEMALSNLDCVFVE